DVCSSDLPSAIFFNPFNILKYVARSIFPACNDLKAGKIDRATYLSILNGLKNIADGAKEEVNEIDIPQELVNYVDENEDRIVNVSKTVAGEGLKFSGIIEAYGLRKKGYENNQIINVYKRV